MSRFIHSVSALKRTLTTALVLLVLLLLPLVVFADNVQNDVVGSASTVTIELGATEVVNYWIHANNGDGQNGCNAADSTPATVTINVPDGVTATPGSLVFTSCGANQPVVFAASAAGNHEITVSVADSGLGTYNANPARFTLQVVAPADTTAPVITPNVSGTLGNNGWYTSDVEVSWTVVDNESAISSSSGCASTTITADTVGTTLTCSATSAGGTFSKSVTIKRDATAPTVSLVDGPTHGTSYYFGSVPAEPTCSASDTTSGLAGACSVSGYSVTVGSHTVTASATDNAGNSATDSATYTVLAWTLTGFYQPVSMGADVWNTVKGGSTVPLKFELFAGSVELTSVSSISGFSASKVSCTSTGTEDAVDFVTTGGTSLRYDLADGQFIQNWQTPKAPGSCYKVTMTAQDGSTLVANFKLK